MVACMARTPIRFVESRQHNREAGRIFFYSQGSHSQIFARKYRLKWALNRRLSNGFPWKCSAIFCILILFLFRVCILDGRSVDLCLAACVLFAFRMSPALLFGPQSVSMPAECPFSALHRAFFFVSVLLCCASSSRQRQEKQVKNVVFLFVEVAFLCSIPCNDRTPSHTHTLTGVRAHESLYQPPQCATINVWHQHNARS